MYRSSQKTADRTLISKPSANFSLLALSAVKLISRLFLTVFLLPAIVFSESREIYEYDTESPVQKIPLHFYEPVGLATDIKGSVYVTDQMNDRIQKLTSDGSLITKWQSFREHEELQPDGIAVDSDGSVYVSFSQQHHIRKFVSGKQSFEILGSKGSGDGEFRFPYGIAISNHHLYVVDTGNNRIQKLTKDGEFVIKWDTAESDCCDGDFDWPRGIAVDSKGFIYVADTGNERILKFREEDNKVECVRQWSSEDGTFNPYGIAADSEDHIYVTDRGNHRVIKFTNEGEFIDELKNPLTGERPELDRPEGIAIGRNDMIYVADTGNRRVLKFGKGSLTHWGGTTGDNEFNSPDDMAMDSAGNLYVADTSNHCIKKFDKDLEFITRWGEYGDGEGQFNFPYGIATGVNDTVYVADTENHRIQTFTKEGEYKGQWGGEGTADGKFDSPYSIATDKTMATEDGGYVYVADTNNHRIQIFKGNEPFDFVEKWDKEGDEDWDFSSPRGVAADKDGNLYVADKDNHRVLKFSRAGGCLRKWEGEGAGEGQFKYPNSVTVDGEGGLYVTDMDNNRVQKFNSETGELIAIVGECGSFPGQLQAPGGSAVTPDGKYFYIADNNNHRIQRFKRISYKSKTKAIIVVGGGYYEQDPLWDAKHSCAYDAYQTLHHSGFVKKTIYYLSDMKTDWDDNGELDDIDGDASGIAFEKALKWAEDAESLLIYLVDHGKKENFCLKSCDDSTEHLLASELASSLDELQAVMRGKLILIYDACDSGSFLPSLMSPETERRIIITSTTDENPDEEERASFEAQGDISFSRYFWKYIRTGRESVKDAFEKASDEIYTETLAYPQKPSCHTSDDISVEDVYIRSGTGFDGDEPITSESKQKAIVMSGTGFDGDEPITSESKQKAIVMSGASWSDGIKNSLEQACDALTAQGYNEENDIYLMSPESLESCTKAWKGRPARNILQGAIETWALESGPNVDLLLYLIGEGKEGVFQIEETDTLTAEDLDKWLDDLQNEITGQVIVIYDAAYSGSFLPKLKPTDGKERIVITSTSDSQSDAFLSKKENSFSHFFWTNMSDVSEMNLLDAFWRAKNAIEVSRLEQQTPYLDDNGNGKGNEKGDGELAKCYFIGKGVDEECYSIDNGLVEPVEDMSQVSQEDGYEDDDDIRRAKEIFVHYVVDDPTVSVISDNILQHHKFHDAGDADWVKFYGAEGKSYDIRAYDLGAKCDVVIELYDADGVTLLRKTDKIGDPGGDEFFTWRCPKSGEYYLKTYHCNKNIFGIGTDYYLKIKDTEASPLSAFKTTVTDALTDEPIEGVKITIGPFYNITDKEGICRLVGPPGKFELTVEASGYQRISSAISFSDGELQADLGFELVKTCHSADYNPSDHKIALSELLRVIQIYNDGAYRCDPGGEDGYALTGTPDYTCSSHDSDYKPQDWRISLSELLRLIQLYNSDGYHPDPLGEDNFAPGK